MFTMGVCVWWVRKHLGVISVRRMIWTIQVFFQITVHLRDRETAQASWFSDRRDGVRVVLAYGGLIRAG